MWLMTAVVSISSCRADNVRWGDLFSKMEENTWIWRDTKWLTWWRTSSTWKEWKQKKTQSYAAYSAIHGFCWTLGFLMQTHTSEWVHLRKLCRQVLLKGSWMCWCLFTAEWVLILRSTTALCHFSWSIECIIMHFLLDESSCFHKAEPAVPVHEWDTSKVISPLPGLSPLGWDDQRRWEYWQPASMLEGLTDGSAQARRVWTASHSSPRHHFQHDGSHWHCWCLAVCPGSDTRTACQSDRVEEEPVHHLQFGLYASTAPETKWRYTHMTQQLKKACVITGLLLVGVLAQHEKNAQKAMLSLSPQEVSQTQIQAVSIMETLALLAEITFSAGWKKGREKHGWQENLPSLTRICRDHARALGWEGEYSEESGPRAQESQWDDEGSHAEQETGANVDASLLRPEHPAMPTQASTTKNDNRKTNAWKWVNSEYQ